MRQTPEEVQIDSAAEILGAAFDPQHAGKSQRKQVTILLALFNGARFIQEQLDSIAGQTHRDWRLIISDDGSTDASCAIVRRWATNHPRCDLQLINGPRQGFAQNFLFLLSQVDANVRNVAFSDQDDVWLPDKLDRALAALARQARRRPALYCGSTWVCDRRLGRRRMSQRWPQPPSFRNALVQNIAAGNTIVLNHSALRLLRAANRRVTTVAAHDWWAYQLVIGAGGQILQDDRPGLLYRQHDANVIGANRGPRAVLRRFRMVFGGEFREWNDQNLNALSVVSPFLTPENRSIAAEFDAARRAPLLLRPWRIGRLGLHRQSRVGTGCLWLMAALGFL